MPESVASSITPSTMLPSLRHDRRLSSGAVMAAGRGLGIGLQLASQWMLAHLGGPSAIAAMQTYQAWATVLGELAAQGTPARSMRSIAAQWPDGSTPRIARALQLSHRQILIGAFLTTGLGGSLAVIAPGLAMRWLGGTGAVLPVLMVVLGAIAFAFQRLNAEAGKAMGRALSNVLSEALIPPGLLVLALGGFWALSLTLSHTSVFIIGFAALLATAAGLRVVNRQTNRELRTIAVARTQPQAMWDAETLSLWSTGLISILGIQLPFLVMPIWGSSEMVGTYAVAFKLLAVATTLLVILSAVFGPALARAAAAADKLHARRLLLRSQIISCCVFIPISLLVLLFTPWLAELFNTPGNDLQRFILIIAAGQLVNAATGLPGLLLNMSGAARTEFRIAASCLLLTLMLVPITGNLFGIAGLASVFSVMTAVKNITSLTFAHTTIGGWPS